jgi:hypothetical protein
LAQKKIMRYFSRASLILSLVLFFIASVSAQVSKLGFNYQGVYRDNKGVIQKNKSVKVNFLIYKGSVSGSNLVYSESQSATTDDFGVFNMVIGSGTPASTIFSDVDWSSSSPYYVKTQIEINGTATDVATTQLMAVPFAKSAATTEMISSQSAKNGNVLIYDSITGKYKPATIVPYAAVSGTTLLINNANPKNGDLLMYDSITHRYIPTQVTSVAYANVSGTTDMINTKGVHNNDVLVYDSVSKKFVTTNAAPYANVSGTTDMINAKNVHNNDVLVYDSVSKKFVTANAAPYASVSGTTSIINNKNAHNRNVLIYDSISGQYKPGKIDSVAFAGTSGNTQMISTKGIRNGYTLYYDSASGQFKPGANPASIIDTKNMNNGDLLTYDSLNNKFVAYANPWSNYAILEERNGAGINEGANTTGWQVRALNATVDQAGNNISLNTSTYQVSLAPGKYYIKGYIVSGGYNMRITSMLFNATDNTPAILGSSTHTTTASGSLDVTSSFVEGMVTVTGTGTKKFELQMYADAVANYIGLGSSVYAPSYKGASTYKPEVYAHLFIQKIK